MILLWLCSFWETVVPAPWLHGDRIWPNLSGHLVLSSQSSFLGKSTTFFSVRCVSKFWTKLFEMSSDLSWSSRQKFEFSPSSDISSRVNYVCWKWKDKCMGSGCGFVGRAVASDNRAPQFESCHQQTLYRTFVYCQLYFQDKNKEKMTGNGIFFKKQGIIKFLCHELRWFFKGVLFFFILPFVNIVTRLDFSGNSPNIWWLLRLF